MPLVSYDIDFKKMVEQLVGKLLRQNVRVAWLTALLKPFNNLHDTFLTYTNAVVDEIKWNGQTIVLERLLIEKFGAGITITNNNGTGNAFVLSDGDESSSFWSDADEASSYFYDESDIVVSTYNFTVSVPSAITFVMSEMEAYINKYKMMGTTYNIVIV